MPLIGELYPQPPYDFDLLIGFLTRHAHSTMDIAHTGRYRRLIPVPGGAGLVEVRNSGSVEQPGLTVTLLAAQGEPDRGALLDSVAYLLSVDEDRRAFYAAVQGHPLLWQGIAQVYGLPALRSPSVYEALMNTIIEQQITWTSAQRAQRWLLEWANPPLIHEGRAYYPYPTPEQIAAATVDELKPLKITHKRIRLLIEISEAVATGALDLEGLRGLPHEGRYAALLAIKGIGHWTAVVTLGRAFGWSREVADNDVALQAAVNRYYHGQEGRIPPEAVRATFAPLGDFAGTAAYHTLVRWVLERYPLAG